ncbi:MAG: hypothetical protein ACFFDN_05240 [Candidatus Hodarchaeota archaeon]
MEKQMSYIIVFPDGALTFSYVKPEKDCYQKDTRLFVTYDEIYLYNIQNWISNNYQENNLIKKLNL